MSPERRATTRARLLRLERQIGIPSRGLPAGLIGERSLVAALLVVVLCLVAVRRTEEPFESAGARP